MKKLLLFLLFQLVLLGANPAHAVQSLTTDQLEVFGGEKEVQREHAFTRGKKIIGNYIIKKLIQPKKKKKRRKKKGVSKLKSLLWVAILSYIGGIAAYILAFVIAVIAAAEGAAVIFAFLLFLLSGILMLVGFISIILWFIEATRAIDELNKDKEDRKKKEKLEKRKKKEMEG